MPCRPTLPCPDDHVALLQQGPHALEMGLVTSRMIKVFASNNSQTIQSMAGSTAVCSSLPVTAVLAWETEGLVLAAQGPAGPALLLHLQGGGDPLARLQVLRHSAVHGLQWLEPGLAVIRGGKSTAVVEVAAGGAGLVVRQEEVEHQDWLLACRPATGAVGCTC